MRIWTTGLLLCALLAMAGLFPQAPPAARQRGDPPAITVTAGGVALPYSVGLNIWNGALYDRLDTFGIYQAEHRGESIPAVPLGATIRIAFDGDPPDGCTLYDFAYGAHSERQVLPLEVEGGTAAFALTAFPEVLLDAVSVEYGLIPDPRGFLLVCSWGDDACEYAFLLTTGE